ncbi:hypothetical protein HMPREF1986_02241 [Oribacterium sp. oral taxon 078 str. F0263]|nr:hypothetical protein HMPREF1986_02241 [Oribacterium sp. oral taxon 078 str. F0263]
MVCSWETKRTVINGHRLRFNGTAVKLFGKWTAMYDTGPDTILTHGGVEHEVSRTSMKERSEGENYVF